MGRRRVLWQMATGQVIDIRDMTASHLMNCIALMQRRVNKYRTDMLDSYMGAFSFLQGEYAQDAVEHEIDAMCGMSDMEFLHAYTDYDLLVEELRRREKRGELVVPKPSDKLIERWRKARGAVE